jgi:hypothetical protein
MVGGLIVSSHQVDFGKDGKTEKLVIVIMHMPDGVAVREWYGSLGRRWYQQKLGAVSPREGDLLFGRRVLVPGRSLMLEQGSLELRGGF